MLKHVTAWIASFSLLLSASAMAAQSVTSTGPAPAGASPTKFKKLTGVPRTEFYWGILGAMKIPVYSEDLLPKDPHDRKEVKVTIFDNCGAGLKHDLMTFVGLETCEAKSMTFEEYAKAAPAEKVKVKEVKLADTSSAPSKANRTLAAKASAIKPGHAERPAKKTKKNRLVLASTSGKKRSKTKTQ